MSPWRPAASAWRAAFIAASVSWAVLLVAAPFLASRSHASTLASLLIVAVYGTGSFVCHQVPERSYHLWTAQMPVCARCAGIYVGAVLGVLGALALRAPGRRAPSSIALRRPRLILGLALAPTLVTLVYEWTTGVMPSHATRAAAGAVLGLVVAWLVVAAADNQVN